MTEISDSMKEQWSRMIASARPSDLAKLRLEIYKEVKEELEPRSTNNSAHSILIELSDQTRGLISVWSDAIMIGINGPSRITHRAYPLHSMVLREYEISLTVRLNRDKYGVICYQPYYNEQIYRRHRSYQWLEVYSEIPTRKKHLNKQAIVPKMGQQVIGELVALIYRGVDFHIHNGDKRSETILRRLVTWMQELKVKTTLADEELEQLHSKIFSKDIRGSFFRTANLEQLVSWIEEVVSLTIVEAHHLNLKDFLIEGSSVDRPDASVAAK